MCATYGGKDLYNSLRCRLISLVIIKLKQGKLLVTIIVKALTEEQLMVLVISLLTPPGTPPTEFFL